MATASQTVGAMTAAVGEELGAVTRAGGHNSAVYRVTTVSGAVYAVKHYLRRPGERDRLAAEFAGLEFLWTNGVRCVPRPVRALVADDLAVYEWIDGIPAAAGGPTVSDIDEAVAFLATLWRLRDRPQSRTLPPAADACFSIDAIVADVARRLATLRAATGDAEGPVKRLVEHDLPDALRAVAAWADARARTVGATTADRLLEAWRTLSPSDFGFHNALRRGGRLVFVDFEYFGWDDPAKMIVDFVLHPAMQMPRELAVRFVDRMIAWFPGDADLVDRVVTVYPLFGLKWCTILLNEFRPEHLARRHFAAGSLDVARACAEQLTKARAMLTTIMETYERFPYHG